LLKVAGVVGPVLYADAPIQHGADPLAQPSRPSTTAAAAPRSPAASWTSPPPSRTCCALVRNAGGVCSLRRPGVPRLAAQPRRPEAGTRLRPAPARQARRGTPPVPSTSSPSAASATAWQRRRTAETGRAPDPARRIQRRTCCRPQARAAPISPRRRVIATMAPCHTRNHIPPPALIARTPASAGPIASHGKSGRPQLRRP
jgi:hypothetical protein